MVKKLVASLAAVAIVTNAAPVFAQDAEENFVPIHKMEETHAESIELTVDDAIALAMENNPRIEAQSSSVKSAELSLEVTKETQKEFDKMTKYVKVPVKISEGLDTAYLKHGYYPYAAQIGLELAQMSKNQVIAAISYEVTEKYYNVKLMEKLVGISQSGLDIAKENHELMKNYFEAGLVSALEVKNAENAVRQSENNLKKYERTLFVATESLRVSLQIDGTSCKLVLTDEIALPTLPENKDELIANAINTRYDITAARKDFELKSKKFDIAKAYLTDDMALYHQVYSEYLKSKYTYENAEKMIKLGLENEFTGVLGEMDAISVAEYDLEIKQALYESAKVKHELGMITNLELTGAMAELEASRVTLENARVTYALGVIKFGYNTTIGI